MSKTLIIAEAGVNHNGCIQTAKKLIDAAVEAKVDFVKFQTFKADTIVSKKAKKAKYQMDNTGDEKDTQYKMLKKLELSHEDHLELINYCESKGISFFSTAFDVEGVNYLDSLKLPLFKVPSGEITNYPYLKAIALKNKPVILSTGMCNLSEIEAAISILLENGVERTMITVLHCNTEYPTPMSDVNLKAMISIGNAFGVQVGYSDHTLGVEVPIAAVALGAAVIEKHFTLDRNLPGPDHRASLEPDELKLMVSSIRNIEKAVHQGTGIKEPSRSEIKNKDIARKSIHLRRPVRANEKLTEDDLISLRPGDGISAIHWEQVIGKRALHDLEEFHKLNWNDII
jgi:N-acetylneuraminate synthase/N,N'-diacetyllegionaminate synthase